MILSIGSCMNAFIFTLYVHYLEKACKNKKIHILYNKKKNKNFLYTAVTAAYISCGKVKSY